MDTTLKKYNNQIKIILQIPVVATVISFVIGSVFFGLYITGNESENIFVFGFFYVIIAVIINLVILLILIALSFIHKEHQNIILLRTSLLLINIPVAVLYMFLMFEYR